MKSAIVSLSIASLAAAVPTVTYGPPPGGWESVDYSGVDYSKVDWDNVDYSKVDYSGVDFNKVNYPPGTGANAGDNAGSDKPQVQCPPPAFFTSTYKVESVPEQVVNATGPTGGLPGSHATFWLGLRSDINLVCYDITLTGMKGNYQSPAKTATHIHEGATGKTGPPRIVFPDPVGEGDVKRSAGCVQGPFVTGLNADSGKDQGDGFSVAQIEKNPAAFYVDIHTSGAVPGANRGQFA